MGFERWHVPVSFIATWGGWHPSDVLPFNTPRKLVVFD